MARSKRGKSIPKPKLQDIGVAPYIERRWNNMMIEPPRFENSYYAPGTAWFTAVFQSNNGFFLKPQSVLRPHYPKESSDGRGSSASATADHASGNGSPQGDNSSDDGDEDKSSGDESSEDDEGGDDRNASADPGNSGADQSDEDSCAFSESASSVSLDSMNDTVRPRRKGRVKIRIPDFVITTSTSSTTGDAALVIVEFKQPGVHFDQLGSENQLLDYLFAIRKKRLAKDVLGLLIAGGRTWIWHLDGQTKKITHPQRWVKTLGPKMQKLLKETMLDHWRAPRDIE